MKTTLAGLLLWLLTAGASWAQTGGVKVELALEQEQFLPGEDLRVAVRITNLSGQTLAMGGEADWLTFQLEALDNYLVPKTSEPSVTGEFSLKTSTTGTKRVNLAPCFNLQRPGRYRVTAQVKIPEWNEEISSGTKTFDITKGTKLQTIEFGVPAAPNSPNRKPEVRKYILQQAQAKEMQLYVRLTDESEATTFKVLPIARMMSFSRPEAQLDQFSNLHLLHQTGQKSFNYTMINSDGQMVARQTHDYSGNSRPRLKIQEDGHINVSGGFRRDSPTDLPPPADADAIPNQDFTPALDAKKTKL